MTTIANNEELNPKDDKLNIVFMVDATSSMSTTLLALKPALSQLCNLLPIFVSSSRFYIAIYRDFDLKDDNLYKCYGPYKDSQINEMIKIIESTQPIGGADDEEAQKFAFNMLLTEFDTKDKTVVFHYTDAPPHTLPYPTVFQKNNHYTEGYQLKVNGLQPDWVKLCLLYKERGIPVYTIGSLSKKSHIYYSFMASPAMTNGALLNLKNISTENILKVSVILISRVLGYDDCNLQGLASLVEISNDMIDNNNNNMVESELSPNFANLKIKIHEYTDNNNDIPQIPQVSSLCTRLSLEKRYKNDFLFQNLCYDTFTKLIKDNHILALTYNPLMGSLYRQMCRKSHNADSEAKRQTLNNVLSDSVAKLKQSNPIQHEQVAKWLEESYNRIEEINDLLLQVINTSANGLTPFLTLQVEERMTKKDLTNACKIPMPHHLKKLSDLILNISIVNKKPKTMPEVFLPLSLENKDLFSLLSHLMCPGVRLDFKPTIIMALLSLQSESVILANRALEYLTAKENVGKWFDSEGSEWYLFGFIRLVLNLNKKYNYKILTDYENEYLSKLFKISSLKYNNTDITVKRKFRLEPEHKRKYHDYKMLCVKCNQYRSLSIMTPDGCGLCLSYSSEKLAELTDPEKTHSYLFSCSTCECMYAVRNIDNLKTKPKCYYCRQVPIQTPPKIVCKICNVGMVLPDTANKLILNLNDTDSFICSLCNENGEQQRIEIISARVHELLNENNWLIPFLLDLNISYNDLCGTGSLFSLKNKFSSVDDKIALGSVVTNIDATTNTNIVTPPNTNSTNLLYLNKRQLLNTDEIINDLRLIVKNGIVGMELCIICYKECIHSEVSPICYHKGCTARACRPCIEMWFSGNAPGHRIMQNRITCPSCKKIPKKGHSLLNPQFKFLASNLLKQKLEFDHDWHYAWCISCNKVKEYMERQCAGPDPMEIKNFTCEECIKPSVIYKQCPKCNLPTAKSAGCDHLECPINLGGCGIHWCYRCPNGPTTTYYSDDARDIYNHLYDVHGNITGAPDDVVADANAAAIAAYNAANDYGLIDDDDLY